VNGRRPTEIRSLIGLVPGGTVCRFNSIRSVSASSRFCWTSRSNSGYNLTRPPKRTTRMPRLVVNPGSPTAWEIQLKPGDNFIGRGFANDFKLTDPSVSSSHCLITVSGNATLLKDLGSTNGSFVNRSPVREAALQGGQTVHLGGVEMLFQADEPTARVRVEASPRPAVRLTATVARPPAGPASTEQASPGAVEEARPQGVVATVAPKAPSAPVALRAAPAAASGGRAPVQLRQSAPETSRIPPPPIPAIPIAPLTSGPQNCKHHPKTAGRFFCPQCAHAYCELCVNTRQEGAASRKFCRSCGTECSPLQVRAPIVPHAESFFTHVFTAFGYPLKGDGIILLMAGTVFFAIIDAAKFFAMFAGLFGLVAILILFILGTGYLTCYLQRIVASSGMGETNMPDWPDVSDLGSDVIGPFLQFLGITLVCFLPAMVLTWLAPHHVWAEWLVVPAIVLGCIYFPMGFLAVAILDSVFAVNPLLVLPAIVKIPLEYLLTIFLFGAAVAVRLGGEWLLRTVVPYRIVTSLIVGLIGLYVMLVLMRILGLLYLHKKHRLGWLSR
jgi:FHA domain-containing protein